MLTRVALCLLALSGVQVPLLYASPTMVRLGYSDCATCHISPQGGGLLTTYGKGVDEAQSFRRKEVHPVDTSTSRLLYDVRLVTASQLVDTLATSSRPVTSSTLRLQARSSARESTEPGLWPGESGLRCLVGSDRREPCRLQRHCTSTGRRRTWRLRPAATKCRAASAFPIRWRSSERAMMLATRPIQRR